MGGEIIKNLKEFIWDIIGYMIPGFLLIISFNLFFVPEIGIKNNFLIDWTIFGNVLIIVLSYVLGYVVSSLSVFKTTCQNFLITELSELKKFLDKSWFKFLFKTKIFNYCFRLIFKKHHEYWSISFETSETVLSARNFLKSNGVSNYDKLSLSELRSIFMSRNPSMDQKIYTFMFRSAVFDHISTIALLICILAFIQIYFVEFEFLKTNIQYKTIYTVLLLIIPLLGNSKRYFYSISRRIPLSNLK